MLHWLGILWDAIRPRSSAERLAVAYSATIYAADRFDVYGD